MTALHVVEDLDEAMADAYAEESPAAAVERAVIKTNLAYARLTRGQFPHARALVMAEGITNAVRATSWRAL